MKRTAANVFVWTFVLLSIAGEVIHACPNCKESTMPGGESVSSGFSSSIYLMMTVPILLLAGFGFRVWHAARRQRLAEHATASDSPTID